jgi:hypothetical protein
MAQASPKQSRIALVVGNADYEHAEPMRNAIADVRAIAAKLRSIGFDEPVLLENLGYEGMRRALRQFARAAEGADVALVYYAGHGLEMDGENYLLPVDAALERDRDIAFETVPLGQVIRAIDGPGTLRLVILDACRDNPFRAKMLSTGARARSLKRGLAEIEPSGNVLIALSARGGTIATDGDGEHSPFTEALLNHLAQPGLEIGFLFRHVRDEVLAATNQQQEPHLYGSLGATPIYLVPAEAPPPVTQASGADVFVSYASADRDRAEELARSLESDGYRVWWDTKLLGGDQFRKVIVTELEQARAAIVIWTKASVESDWVYEEARRARDTRKLIPVRIAELDPKEIQPPFGALHTLLIGDRAGLRAALAKLNVLPAQPAAKSERPPSGPVDDRTVEHNYWIAIQDSSDPSDFEMFLQKFAGGVYGPVARRRVESLLAAGPADVIARFLQEHPTSVFAPRAHARCIAIEWSKVAPLHSADKLRAFMARYAGSPEAASATAELAKLEWAQLSDGDDTGEIERFVREFPDCPEAVIARQRLGALRHEAEAWQSADTAASTTALQQYLRDFPRGKHATQARERLRAAGSPTPPFAMPQIDLKTLPYATIAIVGAGLGVLSQVFSQASLYAVEIGDFYLFSAYRALYVGAFVLLVIKLTYAPNIQRLAALLLGLYAIETVLDAFPFASEVVTALWMAASMLIEWLCIALLFFTLRDKIMMVIAALGGLVFGIVTVLIDAGVPYPASGYLIGSLSFALTGLCIAYGIRRQKRIADGASLGWFEYA